MRFGSFALTALWLSLSLFSGLAQAQRSEANENGDVYSISGTCSSQGAWTQQALAQTARLKEVITRLKDNPKCQSFKASVSASLEKLDGFLSQLPQKAEESSDSISKLESHVTDLRTMSREVSPLQNQLEKDLLKTVIQRDVLKANQLNADGTDPKSAQLRSELKRKFRQSLRMGLDYFNTTVDSLRGAEEGCLDATTGAHVFSGMIQTAAAFAGASGDGVASGLGRALNNLVNYYSRDKKYIESIRRLNDRQFVSSMQCLVEATSEGYCSALDGRYLLEEILSQHKVNKKEVFNERTKKNEIVITGESENFRTQLLKGPLAGYYILSRQVQVITDWIQKVQYGNTPQLPTDASFQTQVITNINDLIRTMKTIEGQFNYQLVQMQEPTMTHEARQSILKNVIVSVVNSMQNDRGENFFTKVANEQEMIFGLLGMPIPDAVLGKGGPQAIGFVGEPIRWVDANYRTIPQFANPEQLAQTVRSNLDTLFRKALNIANAYYNKYFIVDKNQIVNDSLLGLDTNVRDALAHIDIYLKDLQERIVKANKDPSIVASIQQTRMRISKVLTRYKSIREFGLKLVSQNEANQISATEFDKKMKSLGESLLQEFYEQFEVMLARSGWLSKRMTAFVIYDYSMSIRNQDTFKPYLNDLYMATGFDSLRQMFEMSELSYTKAFTDLNSALNIHSENLRALEGIATDVFQRQLVRLTLDNRATPLKVNALWYQANKMQIENELAQVPGDDSYRITRMGRAVVKNIWMGLTGLGSENWQVPSALDQMQVLSQKPMTGVTNEFQTHEKEKALICAQTLAFLDLRPYWSLCKKTSLMSPLASSEIKDEQLKQLIEGYLSVPFVAKAFEGIAKPAKEIGLQDRLLNHSKRICAVRDFHRRNEIAKRTAGIREDNGAYENEFTKVIEQAEEEAKKILADQAKQAKEAQEKLSALEKQKAQDKLKQAEPTSKAGSKKNSKKKTTED